MKRSGVLSHVLVLLPLLSVPCAAEVEVTYLANEGFLLEAGDTRVLIDALFGDGLAGYDTVPTELRAELEAAQGRFAGIDLVLATHYHGDHFDPQAVARHLRANPRAQFVSTRQAVKRLLAVDGSLAPRAQGFWPAEGEREQLEVGGVGLTVLRLHHGRGRRPPVENLGFLFELGGVRFLHVGDTEVTLDDIRPYDLGAADIDVAMLPPWQVSGEGGALAAAIGAERQVIMHLGAASAPARYFYPEDSRAKLVRLLEKEHPGSWVPVAALESRRFGSEAPRSKDDNRP